MQTKMMSEVDEDLLRRLRGSGLRLTPQRLLILDTLRQSEDHISAEQICSRVRDSYPFVNISTVYRTLDVLRELELVTAAQLGDGSLRYHWADKGRHHHLICQRCREVADLDEELTRDLERGIEGKYGFKASLSHLTIFGVCRKCRR